MVRVAASGVNRTLPASSMNKFVGIIHVYLAGRVVRYWHKLLLGKKGQSAKTYYKVDIFFLPDLAKRIYKDKRTLYVRKRSN